MHLLHADTLDGPQNPAEPGPRRETSGSATSANPVTSDSLARNLFSVANQLQKLLPELIDLFSDRARSAELACSQLDGRCVRRNNLVDRACGFLIALHHGGL